MDLIDPREDGSRKVWNRQLLSCGAAAGVAAGFNAPLAGVFFALEIMQDAFNSVADDDESKGLFSSTAKIAPILLASVLSALCARTLLGNHLALEVTSQYSLQNPLIELPLYLLLGLLSGVVAFLFSQTAKVSKDFFAGNLGSGGVRETIRCLPEISKPVIGGLLCGLVGLTYPQILFFGYETLNPLLSNNTLPTSLLLTLLVVKIVMTAIAAGSGLVGGTFAPALFLGAMTGASFHNLISEFLLAEVTGQVASPLFHIADVPAYAMVGAGSVLAALFRAPLTASLLLFEVTHDYDVILPLMASAGVGSVFADILDGKFKRETERRRRRDQDAVSWGDLSE
jgi:H+/Cl- antiporter ClcA